jgi:hypothetical protein
MRRLANFFTVPTTGGENCREVSRLYTNGGEKNSHSSCSVQLTTCQVCHLHLHGIPSCHNALKSRSKTSQITPLLPACLTESCWCNVALRNSQSAHPQRISHTMCHDVNSSAQHPPPSTNSQSSNANKAEKMLLFP